MKIVLLSGGSGKRLFPLSNDTRSKQFLKLLPNEENSQKESMVQRVWKQIKKKGLEEHTFICSKKEQIDMIHRQIDDANVIEEPEGRDTFPAIVYSALFLEAFEGISDNEDIVFMPVDPYVEDHFFDAIDQLVKNLNQAKAEISLLGVEPKHPSTRFGYIEPNQTHVSDHYQKVKKCREKPTKEMAEELIQKGSLWNCGVFAFKLGYLKSVLKQKNYPNTYEEVKKQFKQLPKISFDYEVLEKTKNIIVTKYKGMWKDLGTWDTITEHIDEKMIGIGSVSHCENTHAINEMNIPMIIRGLKDVIVAATPDGILVSSKKESVHLKEDIKPFTNRPLFEERRWGEYKVLEHLKTEKEEMMVKHIKIEKDKNISYQKHFKRHEVWNITKGEGLFASNDNIKKVKEGDTIIIKKEEWHGIKALTDLEFIEIQKGEKLVEEDIVRKYMSWEEVERELPFEESKTNEDIVEMLKKAKDNNKIMQQIHHLLKEEKENKKEA